MESREPEVECLICVLKALNMLSTCVGSLGELRSILFLCSLSENNDVGIKTVCKFDNVNKQVTGKHNDG